MRADFRTFGTSDTGSLACFAGDSPFFPVHAADVNQLSDRSFRSEFDDGTRASLDAHSTPCAFLFEYLGTVGFRVEPERSERAGLDTVALPQTSVCTAVFAGVECRFDRTSASAVVTGGRNVPSTIGIASDHGYSRCGRRYGSFQYRSDLFHHFCSPDGTTQRIERISGNTGRCKPFAAGESASAAIGLRKDGFDRFAARVFRNVEFLCYDMEDNGTESADASEGQHGIQDDLVIAHILVFIVVW